MFERFTQRARHVVVLAQEEARFLDHNYIGTEHILLGLIHEEGGVAARVITSAGLSLEAARAAVEQIIGRGKAMPTGHIPFTPRAKKILELSLREALEQKKSYIGTEHILLALVREGHGVGARILERLAAPAPALRQQVLAAADAEPDGTGGAADLESGDAAETSSGTGLPSGLPPQVETWRNMRVQGAAIRELRETLRSIDRRLAAIERHLGIATEVRGPVEPPAPVEPHAPVEPAGSVEPAEEDPPAEGA